ncbi:MAG: RidA family protein [Acidimicrobiales bacterium]|nr:RidA family protein [Acidimicrobiales bacterium]MDG2218735.1 RidA family protein [Acidimicrobiales bacterium]
MAIDVPYSFLVRDGAHAWSCGQLALDHNSNVISSGDLPAQSEIVANYVAEILGRADLSVDSLVRLVLFVDASHLSDSDAMCAAFYSKFSAEIILDIVPVPHFYYDGVVLEVDVFCGGAGRSSTTAATVSRQTDGELVWASINAAASHVEASFEYLDSELATAGIDRSQLLSAHWTIPPGEAFNVAHTAADGGLLPDVGAIVSAGTDSAMVNGRFVFTTDPVTAEATATNENVVITATQSERFGWVQARSIDANTDLVDQTRQIMTAIESRLAAHDVGFDAVVKATSLYTGGNSAAELHDNMSVRNAYYERPGPASTGLPVFGLADKRSRIVVDVTYAKGSANGSSGKLLDALAPVAGRTHRS